MLLKLVISFPLILQLILQLLKLDLWCPIAAGTAATAVTGHRTSSFREMKQLPTHPATPKLNVWQGVAVSCRKVVALAVDV